MSMIKIRVKTGPELEKLGFIFKNGGIWRRGEEYNFAHLFGKTLFGEYTNYNNPVTIGVHTAGVFIPSSAYHSLTKKRSKPKRKARPVKAKKRTATRKKPKKAPKRRR